jgi:starch synthase
MIGALMPRARPAQPSDQTSDRMPNIAIVPSCNTYESHFGPLGVSPSALANGEYRGTWITQYAALLRDRGMRVTLVVPGAVPGTTSGDLMDVAIVPVDALYRLIPERVWRWRLRALGSGLASRGLEKHLTGFDLVYLQEYAYGRAGYLAQHFHSAPVIAAHHGAPISEAPARVLRRLSSFSALTALTRTEADSLATASGGASLPPVHYLPNWVDGRFFDIASVAPVESHIVWSGRFDARIKGLHTLLTAFKALRTDATLELIGSGPDWEQVRAKVAADPALRERVTLTGRIDDLETFVEHLGRAAVYVNASVIEGLPIAVLEALAAGRRTALTELPYVSSDLAGAPEVHRAAPGDAAGLARALESALASTDSPEARRAVSDWTSARFSAEAAGTGLVDLLESTSKVAAS